MEELEKFFIEVLFAEIVALLIGSFLWAIAMMNI